MIGRLYYKIRPITNLHQLKKVARIATRHLENKCVIRLVLEEQLQNACQ